jgi:hypothetical protein
MGHGKSPRQDPKARKAGCKKEAALFGRLSGLCSGDGRRIQARIGAGANEHTFDLTWGVWG